MNDLITELHQKFCEELNRAWLAADNEEFNVQDYQSLVVMLNEASEQGYEFILTRDPAKLIEKRIMNAAEEKELLRLEAWNKFEAINKMIAECNAKGMKTLEAGYELLRSHYTNTILTDFAMSFVASNGPFIASDNLAQIVVFGNTGNFQKDMLLVAIICAQSPHGNASAQSGK